MLARERWIRFIFAASSLTFFTLSPLSRKVCRAGCSKHNKKRWKSTSTTVFTALLPKSAPGREVARYFFQVGAAAGTIAKTMSAYDKTVSDDIYGVEPNGRYVCQSRLYKMLQHEYDLMEHRLRATRPRQNFFAFADTVSAINFSKTIKGDGWLGLRFQWRADGPTNDVVLHVRMLDHDNRLQQQAIGVLGVNLIYGCFAFTRCWRRCCNHCSTTCMVG